MTLAGLPGVDVVVGVKWTQVGPAPLIIDNEKESQGGGPDSGQILDIAIDPNPMGDDIDFDQTIYIATGDGGIWKSTDAGASWEPKTNFITTFPMRAVALDPVDSSIVYAASTVNIYKSIDGGETWEILPGGDVITIPSGDIIDNSLAAKGVGGINRIVVPAPNILLIATNVGLFRSVDGGRHFGSPPLFNDSSSIRAGFVSDLHLDTADPSNTVYAAIQGEGIFVSTDGGETFPDDSNLFNKLGAPTKPIDFISFTQSTMPDSSTIYASVAESNSTNTYKGLFKWTDSDAKWKLLSDASKMAKENGGAQLGHDQTIGVDPQDSNRVYLGFQELYLSTDGEHFKTPAISHGQIHWDHRILVFSPKTHWAGSALTQLYVGTDGGIATSTNGGILWLNLNKGGLATNLFNAIDIGRGTADNNIFTYGATQDTGIVQHLPTFPDLEWHLGAGGDGVAVAVDPTNPFRVYGSTNGLYLMTNNGGKTWTSPSGTGLPIWDINKNDTHVFRLAVDHMNGAIVYAIVGNGLFQSTDSGSKFTRIHSASSIIFTIAIAAQDSNTVWIGLDDGAVSQTTNALSGTGSSWTTFSADLLVNRPPTGIAINPSNVSEVVIVYGGEPDASLREREPKRRVFLTRNSGANWLDISGVGDDSIPDVRLRSAVIDPGAYLPGVTWSLDRSQFVAVGDIGTIITSPDGVTWTQQASGSSDIQLYSIACSGSQFVAVGEKGTILTSPDGVTWTPQASGTSILLTNIVWSGSQFVAVGDNGTIITSPDGVTWTPQASGTSIRLFAITSSDSQFVAVGENNTILTSPDGVTWTPQASGLSADPVTGLPAIIAIVSAPSSEFVAVGDNGSIITSPDGVTWTPGASVRVGLPRSFAWSGSQFVAVGEKGTILTSPDGVTWTPQGSGLSFELLSIAWSGSQFVAVGEKGTILTSPDGVTWTNNSFYSIVVSGNLGVMRTIDHGFTWQHLGFNLPRVSCLSLALDPTPRTSLLRVGTYGRSVFELKTVTGPVLAIKANLAFSPTMVGIERVLTPHLHSVGSSDLTILSITFTPSSGTSSTDFQIGSAPPTPFTIRSGQRVDFTIQFKPSTNGNLKGTFKVESTDPATHLLPVSGIGVISI